MKAVWWSYHRLPCWNPCGGTLTGTARTLELVVWDDAMDHIGKGVVIEDGGA